MDRIGLKLLGPPEVHSGGRPLKFRSRKALALLAYLVAEGDEHDREELAALLWPRSDKAKGRAALRTTLSYLRGPIGGGGSMGSRLLCGRSTLAFDTGQDCGVDLDTVREGWSLSRELSRTGLRSDAGSGGASPREVLQLREAVSSACRGEFMEGFRVDDAPEFEHWLDVERETWRRRANAVFDLASCLSLEGGDLGAAIAAAESWVGLAPHNETAHRRLTEALLAAGDHAGALEAYEECRSVLDRDLGDIPDAATEELAARVREAAGEARASGRSPGRNVRVPAAGAGAKVGTSAGASGEFRRLIDTYRASLAGSPRCVAVLGEDGNGKTSLVEEFLGWTRAEGADVLRVSAVEAREAVPFGLLAGLLRPRVEYERAPDDLLEDVWLSELCRLLPELGERYPDLQPPGPPGETGRIRLFEAASRLLESLSRRAPLVVAVDEVGWADDASLDALAYAAGRWADLGAPVTLVLRVEAGCEGTGEWISAVGRSIPVDRIFLETSVAEGVPGVPAAGSPHKGSIRERLLRLSPTARDLVTAGSVLEFGGGFGSGRLFGVAGLAEDEALPALDESVEAGLLQESLEAGFETSETPDTYTFATAGIRDAVYTAAGAARRRVFHRRALEGPEAETAPSWELARHALAAGRPAEAFRYSVAAGDPVVGLLAPGPSKKLGHSPAARALCEIQAGRPRRAVEVSRTSLEAETSDTWERSSGRLALAVGLTEAGRYEDALRVTNQPVDTVGEPPAGPPSVVGLVAAGVASRAALRWEQARAAFGTALEVCEGLGRRCESLVVAHLCAAEMLAGDPETAHRRALESAVAREGLPVAPLFGDFVRHHEVAALLCGGEEGLAWDQTRTFGARIGDNRRYRIPYLRSLAHLRRWGGDLAGAVEALREAALCAGRLGLPGESWEVLALLGDLCWEMGDEGSARRHFGRAARTLTLLAGDMRDEELKQPFTEARDLLRTVGEGLNATKKKLPPCTPSLCPPEHRVPARLVPAGSG